MPMQKFAVSDDFAKFEAVAAGALNEARKAEVGARGCDLPEGTTGKMTVTNMNTLKLKNKDKEYLGISMQFTVVTPEQFKGRAESRMFGFEDHPAMSTAAKYQQWLDFCENAGLPRDVRQKTTADIFGWFAAETRTFDYIVKNNKGYLNIDAMGKTSLPTAMSTEGAMSCAVGDTILAFGKPFTVVSINGSNIKIRSNETKHEMDVLVDQIKKI